MCYITSATLLKAGVVRLRCYGDGCWRTGGRLSAIKWDPGTKQKKACEFSRFQYNGSVQEKDLRLASYWFWLSLKVVWQTWLYVQKSCVWIKRGIKMSETVWTGLQTSWSQWCCQTEERRLAFHCGAYLHDTYPPLIHYFDCYQQASCIDCSGLLT